MQRAVSCYGVCPENFKVNVIVPGTITEQDEQYVEDLFDSFCDVTVGTPTGLSVNLAKLAATMLSGYAWAPLPRVNVFAEENFEAPKQQRPNVEPITHSRFTDAQRKRAMKEAEDEDAEAEAQLIVGMTGKALDRGSKHLSKQAVAALRKYQANMDAALTGKTNANVVFVEPKVIGGAKIEQRMMYLLEQILVSAMWICLR